MLITLCRFLLFLAHQLLIIFFCHVFQDVSRLAVKDAADLFEGGKANSFSLAAFQYAQVGHGDADLLTQLGERHFSPGHHYVEVYNNWHIRWLSLVLFEDPVPFRMHWLR